jgi:flavin-dependent dehydrogenase
VAAPAHARRNRLTGQVLSTPLRIVRRTDFDNCLFQAACREVDACLQGFAVKDLIRQGAQVCGVRGRTAEGQEREFRAPLVLGCDGFNSIVARKAGLYGHESRHWVVALRRYYQGVAGLDGQMEVHFVSQAMPGYFWIFPLEDGFANVGVGMVHHHLKRRHVNLREALNSIVESPAFGERFARALPLEEPVGWNLPVASKRRPAHGNGFLLLGDAAGLIDPFTGEGIGNALYSARLAAEVAVQAKQAGDYSAAFLKQYEDRLWQALGPELRTSTRLQWLGTRPLLLELVIRKAARSAELSRLLSGMLTNNVPRHTLTNPLFYLRLLFA